MAKLRSALQIILGVYVLVCPLCLCAEGADHSINTAQSIYSNYEFVDYYHLHRANSYPQYLYSSELLAAWTKDNPNSSIKVEYRNLQLRGKYSLKDKSQDMILLNAQAESLRLGYGWHYRALFLEPHISVGDNMGLGVTGTLSTGDTAYRACFSLQESELNLGYIVRSEQGNIPFAWVNLASSLGFDSSRWSGTISLQSIFPTKCDTLFNNDVHSSIVAADFSYNSPNHWQTGISASYSDTDADLSYHDQLYGYIHNLRFLSLSSHLQIDSNHFRHRLGLDTYFCGIGDDTYIDIWPFTYLDVFLAHRTRIKQIGLEAISPSLETKFSSSNPASSGLNWSVAVAYHHLFHKEDIVIRNRRAVLYPIVFTYDTINYNWQDSVNGYFHIPLQAAFRYKQSCIELKLQQVAPIKWSNVLKRSSSSSQAPSDTVKQSQWGGLSIGLNLIIEF